MAGSFLVLTIKNKKIFLILEKQISKYNFWIIFVLWRPQGDRPYRFPLNPALLILKDVTELKICHIIQVKYLPGD
jgi:hypothetical protein